MVESLNKDSLRGDFTHFLARYKVPLSAISPNHTSRPKHDLLKAARHIVDSPTNPDYRDVCTLAFRCLYKEIHGPEVAEIVKKHQHYIILLTGSKNWKQAYVELTTLHGLFTSSSKFSRLLWPCLLRGVDKNVDFPAQLVLSYHFLVLQTLLQCVSGSLASMCKGHEGLNLSIFERVAEVFLLSSNLTTWLKQVENAKYYNNSVKVLAGFVKVAEFMEKKNSICLGNSLLHLKMKLFEFNMKAGLKPPVPEFPPVSQTSSPFIQDLQDIATKSEYPELLARTNLYLTSVLDTESPAQSAQENALRNALKLGTLSHIISLVKDSDLSLPVHMEIMSYFVDQKQRDVITLVNVYLTKIQNATSIEKLVPRFIPAFIVLLGKHRQVKALMQLESLCFEDYKMTLHSDSLALVVEIQLQYLSPRVKSQNRIEKCLKCLAASDKTHRTAELAYKYVIAFPNTFMLSSARIMNYIAPCFLDQPEVSGSLWLGSSLKFNNDQKVTLFRTLLQELKGKVAEKDHGINVLVLTLHVSQAHKLQCMYYATLIYHTEFLLSGFQANSPFDLLYLAQIKVLLLRENGDFKLILQDIDSDILNWSGSSDAEQRRAFITLVIELYHLGYFGLVADVVNKFKDGFDNLDRLQLEFCLADCCLQLSRVTEVPDILQTAGNIMKAMHLSNIAVDCNLLIRWKLTQLEYFIMMNDADGSTSKFQDIEALTHRFPEYNLQADSSDISLSRRLECLFLLAKFLFLASQINRDNGAYVLAFKNLKLSIKFLSSIIIKLDSQTSQLKPQTQNLLLATYSLAYALCRHLGLLQDAIFYLNELEKLNDAVQSPAWNGLYHLELAVAYACTGNQSAAIQHLDKGSKIGDQTGMTILQTLALGARLLCLGDKCLDSRNLVQLQTFQMENLTFEALSSVYLLETILELEFVFGVNLEFGNNKTPPHKRRMLMKAMTVVATNLQQVNNVLKLENSDFDASTQILPHFSTPHIREEILRKVLECKEILENCLEKDRMNHLEVHQVKLANAFYCRCVFLLSFFAVLKIEGTHDLLSTMYFLLDLHKHLPYLNQQNVVSSPSNGQILPVLKEEYQYVNGHFTSDLRRVLPANWLVVTIDICPLSGDVILSKFVQEDGPCFFKIPLETSFGDVLQSLKSIVEDSNTTTKPTVTSQVKTKEDRIAWWKLRFDLDLRLKHLLTEMEVMLGGFKGLFEHPDRSSPNYTRFRHRFLEIWNYDLSDTIVDLFYCARPFDGNGRFDLSLVDDLVKFTTDHTGIDALVRLYDRLETLYYSTEVTTNMEHLVLVPSTACCSFPWESIPILQNRSVSRVPSVNMLLKMLGKSTLSLSALEIFYLVNPGCDLQRTQQKFEPIFKQIPHTSGLCGQPPEEEFLLANLFGCGLYIFLGHGGGEQYVRTSLMLKERAKNKSLPPAILMGCSSGAYQDNGELEPTSNVFKWLLCGSPMVVTNLWDITDKDIDCFSEGVFSKWGILESKGHDNISQAVASSRSSCTLRYLNGAAPIVHGLPLKLH